MRDHRWNPSVYLKRDPRLTSPIEPAINEPSRGGYTMEPWREEWLKHRLAHEDFMFHAFGGAI